ncbi:unnamed protein product [Prunus armeniaca]
MSRRASQSKSSTLAGGNPLVVIVTCDDLQWAAAVVGQVHADGPATAYHRRPGQDIERWKHNGPDLDDLLVGQEECSARLPLKKEG